MKNYKNIKKILFVCHGNICRSPMAEFVFKNMLDLQNINHLFEVDSAATSTDEIGSDVHRGTQNILAQNNIPCGKHRARQMTKADYEKYDLLIGMDNHNVQNMKHICSGDPEGKIRMFLDRSIADPWYTGNFEKTYRDVKEGCTNLLKELNNDSLK
ncbi:MAG: low molecular weight phosphotyrosine protein phosphatase [Treponema sp.]|nr:low molecular weight phosphotyrosine protein phosphatase [Treponema sp.]